MTTDTAAAQIEIEIEIDDSYAYGRDYRHHVVLDPRTRSVTVESLHGTAVTADLWHGRVIRLGKIPDGVADTAGVRAVLARRLSDLRTLADAHKVRLDKRGAWIGAYTGTPGKVDALEALEWALAEAIETAGREAPTYSDPSSYLAPVEWDEIDSRTGRLDLDALAERLVAEARADDVHLDYHDTLVCVRALCDAAIEQAHDDALYDAALAAR